MQRWKYKYCNSLHVEYEQNIRVNKHHNPHKPFYYNNFIFNWLTTHLVVKNQNVIIIIINQTVQLVLKSFYHAHSHTYFHSMFTIAMYLGLYDKVLYVYLLCRMELTHTWCIKMDKFCEIITSQCFFAT